MATREEYKHVLDDLMQIRMFRGIYDAKNGDSHFMNGIDTVMSYIADKAEDEDFLDLFLTNMVLSENKEVSDQLPVEDKIEIENLFRFKRVLKEVTK